ncbi:MAG: hypothetical protein ACLQDM_23860, partial [Bradyrhizobium sp.]
MQYLFASLNDRDRLSKGATSGQGPEKDIGWRLSDVRSQQRTSQIHHYADDRFAPILLKKSAAQLFETAREDRRARILACSGRHWGGERD